MEIVVVLAITVAMASAVYARTSVGEDRESSFREQLASQLPEMKTKLNPFCFGRWERAEALDVRSDTGVLES